MRQVGEGGVDFERSAEIEFGQETCKHCQGLEVRDSNKEDTVVFELNWERVGVKIRLKKRGPFMHAVAGSSLLTGCYST